MNCLCEGTCAPYYLQTTNIHNNMSLFQNEVSLIWKKAKVTQNFKAGNASDPDNYCPTLVLPILSKILEKLFILNSLNISNLKIICLISSLDSELTDQLNLHRPSSSTSGER